MKISEVLRALKCPNCGGNLQYIGTFMYQCPYCGGKFRDEPDQKPVQQQYQQRVQPKENTIDYNRLKATILSYINSTGEQEYVGDLTAVVNNALKQSRINQQVNESLVNYLLNQLVHEGAVVKCYDDSYTDCFASVKAARERFSMINELCRRLQQEIYSSTYNYSIKDWVKYFSKKSHGDFNPDIISEALDMMLQYGIVRKSGLWICSGSSGGSAMTHLINELTYNRTW